MEVAMRVALSRRAALDIREIETYSIEQWGQATAIRYLEAIEAALNRLRRDPDLLRSKPEVSAHFQFYRVREHYLICARVERAIYVLAVRHGSMDLPSRIEELAPTLLGEARLLHEQLTASEG